MLRFKSNSSAHVLTKSWFQILLTFKSMRCRGASLQLIMTGSKSYIPTGIFTKAQFQIFIEIPSPLLLVGMGFKFYKFHQFQKRFRETQFNERWRVQNSASQNQNQQILTSSFPLPPPTLRTYCQFVILRSKSNKPHRVFTKTRFQILIAHWSMRSAALKIRFQSLIIPFKFTLYGDFPLT